MYICLYTWLHREYDSKKLGVLVWAPFYQGSNRMESISGPLTCGTPHLAFRSTEVYADLANSAVQGFWVRFCG